MSTRRTTLNAMLLAILAISATCIDRFVVADEPTRAEAATESAEPETAFAPRDLLELYGVDPSYFRGLIDGRPLHVDENEALLRALYAVGRLRAIDLHRAQSTAAPLEKLVQDPQNHRGQMAHVSGHVTNIVEASPLAELVGRFNLPKYYRCELELDGEIPRAIVYVTSVPAAWTINGELRHPASAWGLFLKNEGTADAPTPVFVAPRIQWHPATLLGTLGMDVGLFDDIRQRHRLSNEDRDCFYRLLDVVARLDEEQDRGLPAVEQTAELAQKMFADPSALAGTRLMLDGVARRAVRIRVDDADIIERFGIDHYYELEVFVDVPGLAPAHNPLIHVCCVREVPDGFPLGENVSVHVRVPVFFFKLWSYQSKQAESVGDNFRQVAPLCIGRRPIWIAPPESAGETLGAVAAGILAAVAVIGVWAAWRARREDARRRRPVADVVVPFDGLANEPRERVIAPPDLK